MATKTITITSEAYEILKRQKKPGETFSELIMHLFQKKSSILDLYGAWKMDDTEWNHIEKRMQSAWSSWTIEDAK